MTYIVTLVKVLTTLLVTSHEDSGRVEGVGARVLVLEGCNAKRFRSFGLRVGFALRVYGLGRGLRLWYSDAQKGGLGI